MLNRWRQLKQRWQPPDAITAIANLRSLTMGAVRRGQDTGMARHMIDCYRALRRIDVKRKDAVALTFKVVTTAVIQEDVTGPRRTPRADGPVGG